MLDSLLSIAGLLVLLAALAIPHKFPKVGALVGCLAVIGGMLLLGHRNEGFARHLFDSLDRLIGGSAMGYGALWIGVATRKLRSPRITSAQAA